MSENSKKLAIPNGEYYIGLDIGTNSVGWALTDREYNVLNFNDKATWGVRLFDDAATAENRRSKRALRRRLHRRRVRLNYLKELFRPAIEEIDPNFFKRLQNSYLYVNEDKQSGTRVDFAKDNDIKLYSGSKRFHLFEGSGITDKQYYRDFPTVYHLRSALINGKIPRSRINEDGKYKVVYDSVSPSYNLYDPRLVFLALHSLLKARGSFLYDIKDLSKYLDGNDFEANLNNVATSLLLKFKMQPNIDEIKRLFKNQLTKTITDENGKPLEAKIRTINDKVKKFNKLVEVEDNSENIENSNFTERKKLFEEIIKLAFGGKKSFDENDDEESLLFGLSEKVTITYADEKYEENLDKIRAVSEAVANAIESSYKIYVWAKLSDILKDQPYLCMGKVEIYNKHKNDLHLLKESILEILKDDEEKKEKFKRVFYKRQGEFTYDAYVHHGEDPKKETRLKSFEKHIKNVLGKKDDKDIFDEYKKTNEDLAVGFEDGTFLPVLRSLDNLAVPNVVIREEYQKILEVAKEKGLDFLQRDDQSRFKNDGSGKKPCEKISSLVSFKIPYYVGPLAMNKANGDNDDIFESKNSWIVRKEEYKNKEIMPWIFDNAIDKTKTRAAFIDRMVSNCTYLKGCKVLPKNSIILQKQQVLEELNNLRITIRDNNLSENIDESIALKKYLFDNIFKEVKSPTAKRVKTAIATYFRGKGENIKESDIDFKVGGEDAAKFNSSYSSYIVLKDIKLSDDCEKDIELKDELINLYTIFGSESEIAREEAEGKSYFHNLSDGDKSTIHNALSKMQGWGRYSKELLTSLKVKDPKTNVYKNILSWLENTNYNIQYLMNMKETEENFGEQVTKFNKGITDEKSILNLKYSDINELYIHPTVKRAVWQSVRIIKELVKIVGYAPKKIFIETTRSDGEKGKTKKSRYALLNEKYDALNKQAKDINKELRYLEINLDGENGLIGELNDNANKQRISSERLYLYFMQCGKDMYTGERIALSDLFNSTMYDIDHIYPYSLTNDDSVIENKVLVSKKLNGVKDNDTLKARDTIKDKDKVVKLWGFLLDKGFISKEKYRRLLYSLNHVAFDNSELEGFKNRQLVATSWSTKAVMNLLQGCSFGSRKTEIVSVKANLVSEFRNKNMMYKSREINDIHHAKDAYLNIVVGNVYNTAFSHNAWLNKSDSFDNDDRDYNISSKIYDRKTIVDINGNIAWVKDKSIVTVENMMSKNDALLTRMQTTGKGKLFDATVYSESKTPIKNVNAVTATKDCDTHYGFYNKQSSAFFCLVESLGRGGKTLLSIECIPTWFYNKNKTLHKADIVKKYCELPKAEGGLEMKVADVVVPYIRIKSLLKFVGDNGFVRGYASGKTGNNFVFYTADVLNLEEMEGYAIQVCKFSIKKEINEKLTIDQFNSRIIIADEKESLRRDEKRPMLTVSMNIKLYEKLIQIHKEPEFVNKPSSQLEKLLEPQKGKFCNLPIEDQVFVLCQFIKYLNGKTGDFRLLGGVKEGGNFSLSSNIKDIITVINQSVTGLYENSLTVSLDELNKKRGKDGE